jgi:hypothetical protein
MLTGIDKGIEDKVTITILVVKAVSDGRSRASIEHMKAIHDKMGKRMR